MSIPKMPIQVRNSFYQKLVLALVGVLFVTACGFAVGAYFLAKRSTAANHQAIHASIARVLAEQLADRLSDPMDLTTVRSFFSEVMRHNPNLELYYLGADSEILAHTLMIVPVQSHIDMGPVMEVVAGSMDYPIYGDDPSDAESQALFSAAVVAHAEKLNHYLYVVLQAEGQAMLESKHLSLNIWSLGAIALLGALGLGLLVGLWLFSRLTVRLRLLRHLMQLSTPEVTAEGVSYVQLSNDHSGDEIAELGVCFDQMRARIASQFHALQRQEAGRRQMLANISHDLRTPLTILRGYVETLEQRSQSMQSKSQQAMLQTAARQCVYLQRLIDDLFELARLEAGENPLCIGGFSLHELANDAVMDLAVIARPRGIEVVFQCASHAIEPVRGDVAAMQRVLSNLLANAVRFTPRGGCITLAVCSVEESVMLSVTNTGSYVSPEQIDCIFERFQTGEQHRGGSEHAGLGLAIARCILELHGQKIAVQSDRINGTRFSFELPLYRCFA